MFQTEPILFLQGVSSELFHQFMLLVNQIGAPATGILLALVLVNVDPRKGFLLLQLLIVTAIITGYLKDTIALPRPYVVDSSIQLLDQDKVNETPFVSMGANRFFGALPQSVVDYHRANLPGHWGFPSGHVSSTFVLWASLAMLYRRYWLLLTTVLLTSCVALARLYFGKHFIAGVLGGAILGGVVSVIAYLLLLRPTQLARFLAISRHKADSLRDDMLYYGYLILLPLSLLWASFSGPRELACLLGLNLGFILMRATGRNVSGGSPTQRLGRGTIGLIVLIAVLSASQIPRWYSLVISESAELLLFFVLCFVLITSGGFLAGHMNRTAI